MAWLVLSLAHPIHTTLATVTYDPATAQVTASVRAFASDVDLALSKRPDKAIDNYVRSAIVLTDQAGHPVPIVWCGSRRQADVVWLCVRAAAPRGPSGLMLADRLLFDVFDDQVNIVMTDHTSFVFTKGDPPRRLA